MRAMRNFDRAFEKSINLRRLCVVLLIMSYFVNTHLGAIGPRNLPLEDDEFPRGFRIIDPNQSSPQVGIGFNAPLEVGQTVVERLPLGIIVQKAEAIYVTVTDPNDPNWTIEKVTLSLPPSYIDNGKQVQEFEAAGAVAITYQISGPLGSGERIDGVVIGGNRPGLIHGLSFEADASILDQLKALEQELFSWVNNILCTAFSFIPGQGVKIERDCTGSLLPTVITFDDRPGPFSLTHANEGESKLSFAIGVVEANSCSNLVGQSYMNILIPLAIQGEFWVGAAFRIDPQDTKNSGKKAKATVTIKGGNTSANPHGYEGQLEAFSFNPYPPTPPPVVYPSGGVVSDRIEAQFLSGSTVSDIFLLEQSDLINSEFVFAMTAAPSTCDCGKAEPEDDYEKEFEVELRDGGILPGPDYLMRIFGCDAALTIGTAGIAYKYWGDCAGNTLCGNLYNCVYPYPPPDPIWGIDCIWAMTHPETRQNQRKGLRFEDVSIDFHHIDLCVQSVEIDDSTPLEGVFANIIVTICNNGDPKSDPELIRVQLTDKRTGLFWNWVIDGPDPNECIKRVFPWDTTGLFGTGARDLCVWVESLTVAELDYSDNEGCIQVEVQPSVKAAFVSTGSTADSSCPVCAEVQVWDTRTRTLISSCDIVAQTGIADPGPEGIDVPSSGEYAWVVLTDINLDYAVLGIDVCSCWSGPCQIVAQPIAFGGYANGSIAVDSAGQLAFVPIENNQLIPHIAVHSLDNQAGSQLETEMALPWAHVRFRPTSETTVAAATTNRAVREVYIAGDKSATSQACEGFYSIVLPPPPAEGIATPPPDPTLLCFDHYVFEVNPRLIPIRNKIAGVAFTKNLNSNPGGRAVLTDDLGGYFVTVETGRSDDQTCQYGCWAPVINIECEPNETRGVVPCFVGEAPGGSTGRSPVDVVTTREGDYAFAIHDASPYVLWRYPLPLDCEPAPMDPPAGEVPICPGLGRPPRCYNGRYLDLAITLPTSPDRLSGEELWIVDNHSNSGELDIFAVPSGFYKGSVPVGRPPISITIAPIPLSGQESIFPGPLPIPFPFPIQWPPDVDRDYDFVTLSPVADEFVGRTLLPVINSLPEPAPFHLEFLNLPDGWTVSWDDIPLHFVQPFENEMENIVFVPVELRTPIAPNEPVGLRVRAWSPEGGEPNNFAITLLRADITTCGDLRHPFPAGDLNWDCKVDFVDFAVLAMNWPELFNWATLQKLADSWLACTHPFECPSAAVFTENFESGTP